MAKACVMLSWDEAPHLTAAQKESVLSGIPPWQRKARQYGTPSLGAGAIYPIPEEDFVVPPFHIPTHWPRSYGMDTGWNRTAAIWFAWDVDNGGIVAYDEYYRGQADPAVHTAGINAKGKWIPGVIDPASKGQRGHNGDKLLEVYQRLGLNVIKADNAVEAGLVEVWNALSIGQLKVFNTLRNTLSEMRLYRRNEKGEIVKVNDHLMDSMRYNMMSGRAVAKIQPAERPDGQPWFAWSPPEIWSG